MAVCTTQTNVKSGGAVWAKFMALDRKGPVSDQNADIATVYDPKPTSSICQPRIPSARTSSPQSGTRLLSESRARKPERTAAHLSRGADPPATGACTAFAAFEQQLAQR